MTGCRAALYFHKICSLLIENNRVSCIIQALDAREVERLTRPGQAQKAEHLTRLLAGQAPQIWCL